MPRIWKRPRPRISHALCAGALFTLTANTAWGQVSDKAIAEALFQDGRRLMAEGRLAEGCAKLEQSQRADPQIGTLLNVAVCHEQLGRTASAWAEFLDAEAQASRSGQAERAAFAREGVQRLQGQLSKLVLRTDQKTSGLTIVFDSKPFDASMLNTPLPVDPGEHRLEASAPGKKTLTLFLTVAAGPAEVICDIPPLQDLPPTVVVIPTPVAQPPASPPPAAPPPATQPPDSAEPASGSVPTWAWVSLGVGMAGIVTGTVTGSMALSKATELKADCGVDKVCPSDTEKDLDTALTLADISTASFIVGAVGSAIGITGILTTSGSERRSGFFFQLDISRIGVGRHF
jgi:hypothetical protein